MNDQNFFLTIFVGAVMAASTAGCSDDSGNGGTTGTATNTSTSTSTSTATGTGVELTPGEGGFVDSKSNSLGIQGPWYPYADSLGQNGMPPGACQTVGMHPNAECANVIAPVPGSPFAPTPDGKMCTEGTVEQVGKLNGADDYTNQWGAGIGFDFNNPGGTGTKTHFDAAAAGVTGVSFVIDTIPLPGLRVEFPDAATAGKSAAYADATADYKNSMLTAGGVNVIPWSRVKPPGAAGDVPPLDTSKIMGIQFHVPTSTAAGGSYKFCISKLTMLK